MRRIRGCRPMKWSRLSCVEPLCETRRLSTLTQGGHVATRPNSGERCLPSTAAGWALEASSDGDNCPSPSDHRSRERRSRRIHRDAALRALAKTLTFVEHPPRRYIRASGFLDLPLIGRHAGPRHVGSQPPLHPGRMVVFSSRCSNVLWRDRDMSSVTILDLMRDPSETPYRPDRGWRCSLHRNN